MVQKKDKGEIGDEIVLRMHNRNQFSVPNLLSERKRERVLTAGIQGRKRRVTGLRVGRAVIRKKRRRMIKGQKRGGGSRGKRS